MLLKKTALLHSHKPNEAVFAIKFDDTSVSYFRTLTW